MINVDTRKPGPQHKPQPRTNRRLHSGRIPAPRRRIRGRRRTPRNLNRHLRHTDATLNTRPSHPPASLPHHSRNARPPTLTKRPLTASRRTVTRRTTAPLRNGDRHATLTSPGHAPILHPRVTKNKPHQQQCQAARSAQRKTRQKRRTPKKEPQHPDRAATMPPKTRQAPNRRPTTATLTKNVLMGAVGGGDGGRGSPYHGESPLTGRASIGLPPLPLMLLQ